MPIKTQIERDGKPLPIEGGWSQWHVGALWRARQEELKVEVERERNLDLGDLDSVKYFPDRPYTFLSDHDYWATEEQIWNDGNPDKTYHFLIKKGDVYSAWR